MRQQLLHRLVEQLDYPASLIAVEVPLEKLSIVNSQFSIKQRCDAVVYDRRMQPLMLIECKAETVPLTQKTLDQAVTYNRKLGVPWLVLHNGIQTITINCTSGNNTYITGLPRYTDLLRGE